MTKKRRIIAALCLMILCCAWAATAAAATYGTVFGGWLRLRANPSYSAAIITSYPNGSVVTVLSRSNGWCRVLTSDYRYGYMDQRFLYISGYAPTPDPTPSPYDRTWTTVNRTAQVTSQNGKGVRMRSAPEVNNYNVLGLYPVGRTLYELRRSNDGWSYIRIDGRYGYMMTQFITGGGSPVYPSITDVQINITQPRVGDTLKVTVKPSGANFSVVWYNGDSKLLGTKTTYKVKSSDLGTKILVRVTGSDGTVIKGSTEKVQENLKDLGNEALNEVLPEATPKPASGGMEPMDNVPTETTETVEATEFEETTETTEATESEEATETTEATEPEETTESLESTDSSETMESTETTYSLDATESSENPEP